jgi:glycerophosphoryl diester phosphodiesterase
LLTVSKDLIAGHHATISRQRQVSQRLLLSGRDCAIVEGMQANFQPEARRRRIMKDFFIWAHRGASARAPENTLAAFREAEAAGADGLELDVHLSRDGVPVVIHDDTVDRTTDGSGAVSALTFREIRALDAGCWFGRRFACEPLPTLEEVFRLAGDRLRLNVEIKNAAAGSAVLALMKRNPRTLVLVSSFDHDLLAVLRRQEPGLSLGFLTEASDWQKPLEKAAALVAESFHPRQDLVDAELILACRSRRLAVYPWTVDEPQRLAALRRLGVDGVFCNDPERVARWLMGTGPRRNGGPVPGGGTA